MFGSCADRWYNHAGNVRCRTYVAGLHLFLAALTCLKNHFTTILIVRIKFLLRQINTELLLSRSVVGLRLVDTWTRGHCSRHPKLWKRRTFAFPA
jgi:hypothetical protein